MLQDELWHRKAVTGQFLQDVHRCRIGLRSFGLLDCGILQFLEENVTELLRRVDVELRPRLGVNPPLQLRQLRSHGVRHLLQQRNIDADATIFHSRQHGDERHLDRLVNLQQFCVAAQLRLEDFLERNDDV